ncbi:MAG TPA: ribonuclease III [Candidatus Acidoferrales bacterium]|nr:ribonuclease III [Candidatus Acidoferrales bacterium]
MMVDERETIEALLGYYFKEPGRLDEALTHRSLRQGVGDKDNERLEFLGDRVLGLVVSDRLCHLYPVWDAGQLSKGLARLVNADTLQVAARRLKLGEHLRLGPGEEKTGGREKKRLLSDAYEAVLGAIFLDGGLAPATEFAERTLLVPAMKAEVEALERSDHKSALQEWLQERGKDIVEYRLTDAAGPDHQKTFEVEVWHGGKQLSLATGRTKKEAEQAAAKLALEVLLAS